MPILRFYKLKKDKKTFFLILFLIIGFGLIELPILHFIAVSSFNGDTVPFKNAIQGLSKSHKNSTSQTMNDFLEQQAGLTVYTTINQTIDLDTINLYIDDKTIETDEFVAGSISANEDIYCLVHKQGWIVLYYPNHELTTQRISYFLNDHLEIYWDVVNPLKKGLIEICNTSLGIMSNSIEFYDFRYPYANKMDLLGTYLQIDDHENYGEEIIYISIPPNVVLQEGSWYHLAGGTYHSKSHISIDNENINLIEEGKGTIQDQYGQLNYTQLASLSVNKLHQVNVTCEPYSGVIIENPLGPSPIQLAFLTFAFIYHESPSDERVTLQNEKFSESIDLIRPSFLLNLPNPPLKTILRITPSNFNLTSGDTITLTVTLTEDNSTYPIVGKFLMWQAQGDNPVSAITNLTGQIIITYEAEQVMSNTLINITIIFIGDGLFSASRTTVSGWILPHPENSTGNTFILLLSTVIGLIIASTVFITIFRWIWKRPSSKPISTYTWNRATSDYYVPPRSMAKDAPNKKYAQNTYQISPPPTPILSIQWSEYQTATDIDREYGGEICPICRRTISANQNLVRCPNCTNAFHQPHFAEAIKVTGKCPKCQIRLSFSDFQRIRNI